MVPGQKKEPEQTPGGTDTLRSTEYAGRSVSTMKSTLLQKLAL